jgi:uncharacterized protein
MKLGGKQLIKASKQQVWDALMSPDYLKRSIPGCESVELIGENQYQATVVAAVGPVKAKFTGKILMSDLDSPNSYRVTFVGEGGLAGAAEGLASVTLVDEGSDTALIYEVEAKVSGKIAQIGSRLIDATANKLAGQFFAKFNQVLTGKDQSEKTLKSQGEPASGKIISADGRLGIATPISLTLPAWLWALLFGATGFYIGRVL